MELNAALSTNASVRNLAQVNYGGTLAVVNAGGTLVGGNSFVLFSAAARGGAFSTVTLPSLASGLIWTNKLAIDGSIAVIALPAARTQISQAALAGANFND